MKIYYDNSANAELVCHRRAQYRLLFGIETKPSAEMQFGSAAHRVLECVCRGATDSYDDKNQPVPFGAPLPAEYIMQLPQLIDDATTRFTLNSLQLPKFRVLTRWLIEHDIAPEPIELVHGTPAVELKFTVPHGELVLCGTMDNLSVENDKLVVTDYKFTTSKYPSDYMREYRLKTQLWFYMYVIKHFGSQFLPSKYIGMPLAARIRAVFYENGLDTRDTELCLCDDYVDTAMSSIMTQMVARLRAVMAYHNNNELAPKTGMATGSCYKCPFAYICQLHNDAEERKQIEQASKKQYNPLLFR